MLDEFPALGRLDFFGRRRLPSWLATAFAAFIAQSLNQIDKPYGQNHSILDNCHVRVTFATNDERRPNGSPNAGHRHRTARAAPPMPATGSRRGSGI
ncbi:TraM recognition domain-containing protein [Pseudomonas aeruginosa]